MHVQKGTNDVTLPPSPPEPPDDDNDLASLDELMSADAPAKPRHRRPRGVNWPRLAERILGRWAPTLRLAIVLAVVLTAAFACLVAMWGVLGLACVAALCVLLHRILMELTGPLPGT